MNLIKKAKELIGNGHERTVRAKKNILLAVVFKGVGILVGFAVSPLSVAYLDPTRLGIFILITGMMDWFADFDMGIGNGLKNKFGAAVAKGNDEEARSYVSTAYGALSAIAAALAMVFVFASFVVPWSELTDTDPSMNAEIRLLAIIIFAAFAVRFVSSLIYIIFNSLQQTAKVDFFSLIAKIVFLVLIIILFYTTESSLILFGTAKSFTFAFLPIIIGIWAFRGELKQYAPSFSRMKKSYLKALLSIGAMYFLIRIAMLVIYETNTFLITTLIDIKMVPVYDFPFKYFSILSMFFAIITNQLWGAYVEAYEKGDFEWIKKIVGNLMKAWVGTVALGAIMILFSDTFYYYWINVWQEQDKVLDFPKSVSVFICISVCFSNFINVFNLVLNGTGKIRLQTIGIIVAAILNIPLSIFFVKVMGMGLNGIILGTIVSLIPNAIFSPIQVRKILTGKDKGIWSK